MPTAVKAGPLPTATPSGALKVTYAAGSNRGTKITTFTATCKSPNAGVTKSAVHNSFTAAPITVTGLTTKKTYTCSVTATNAWGVGPASVASAPVIVGAPSAPSGVRTTRTAAGRLQVAFAPGANNGAAITRFTATCKSSDGGVTKAVSSTVHPIAVTGLTAGKTYTCAVSATNSRGVGPQSAPSPAVKA